MTVIARGDLLSKDQRVPQERVRVQQQARLNFMIGQDDPLLPGGSQFTQKRIVGAALDRGKRWFVTLDREGNHAFGVERLTLMGDLHRAPV